MYQAPLFGHSWTFPPVNRLPMSAKGAMRPWKGPKRNPGYPPGKGAASASEEVAGARSPRLPSSTLSTCQAVSGSSERLGFTFSGLGFTRTFRTYTNPTCTEPGTVVSTEDGTSYLVKQ